MIACTGVQNTQLECMINRTEILVLPFKKKSKVFIFIDLFIYIKESIRNIRVYSFLNLLSKTSFLLLAYA